MKRRTILKGVGATGLLGLLFKRTVEAKPKLWPYANNMKDGRYIDLQVPKGRYHHEETKEFIKIVFCTEDCLVCRKKLVFTNEDGKLKEKEPKCK
jgi:hypothetical protein